MLIADTSGTCAQTHSGESNVRDCASPPTSARTCADEHQKLLTSKPQGEAGKDSADFDVPPSQNPSGTYQFPFGRPLAPQQHIVSVQWLEGFLTCERSCKVSLLRQVSPCTLSAKKVLGLLYFDTCLAERCSFQSLDHPIYILMP